MEQFCLLKYCEKLTENENRATWWVSKFITSQRVMKCSRDVFHLSPSELSYYTDRHRIRFWRVWYLALSSSYRRLLWWFKFRTCVGLGRDGGGRRTLGKLGTNALKQTNILNHYAKHKHTICAVIYATTSLCVFSEL